MSITESFHFDKEGEVVRFPLLRRFFLTLVIILVALLAFGIGRLSEQGGGSEGVKIDYQPIPDDTSPAPITTGQTPLNTSNVGSVVASSKGTKYYLANCKNTISAANKVTFTSTAEAKRAGYTLAANCKVN